ncbi:MAG: CHAT domain-containing protein [Flavobacteriales bacterium]|nr:CHAT domain-containing protein [Flavobacteriales bacterium]
MSSEYYRRQVQAHQEKIGQLQKEKSRFATKASDALNKANAAKLAASRTKTISTIESKLREAQRCEEEYAKCQKELSRIEGKITDEMKRKGDAERYLQREEKREAEQAQRKAQEQAREQDERARRLERSAAQHEYRLHDIGSTLRGHDHLHRETREAIQRLERLPERITVLFVAANPLDQQQLRLDEEARAIQDMIRKSKHRDSVDFRSHWAARPLDILQAVNEHDPSIVHFSGHGSEDAELVMQGNVGETRLVTKEAIAQSLATCSDKIKLVFFNTCYSRGQAEAVVKHIPAAIGMNTSVGDHAARLFSSQFYSAIGFGLSVKKSFDQAKAGLMLEGVEEEDVPELFTSEGVDANDLVIVKPATPQ